MYDGDGDGDGVDRILMKNVLWMSFKQSYPALAVWVRAADSARKDCRDSEQPPPRLPAWPLAVSHPQNRHSITYVSCTKASICMINAQPADKHWENSYEYSVVTCHEVVLQLYLVDLLKCWDITPSGVTNTFQ